MIFKQGSLDGLCGIYGLINFIVHKKIIPGKSYEQGREAYRYILESAEQTGHLTAHRLHDGYEWPLLIEIFNHWAALYHHPYKAFALARISGLQKRPTNKSVIGTIINAGGAALVSVKQGKHWILATGFDDQGKFISADPDAEDPEGARVKFDDLTCGLALLPDGELSKDASAQTH